MILKTVNDKRVETFQELGSRFNLVSEKKATDHFQVMLSDIFGENLAQSKGVFAILESYTPGIENICLYEEDLHFLYTSTGEEFQQLIAPVRK